MLRSVDRLFLNVKRLCLRKSSDFAAPQAKDRRIDLGDRRQSQVVFVSQ